MTAVPWPIRVDIVLRHIVRKVSRGHLSAVAAGALYLAGLGSQVFAANIAYEGFEYTEANGTTVGGLNGGTGWDEPFPTPNNTNLNLDNGLSFPGLITVGKSMTFGANANLNAGRDWDNSASPLANGSTYWYSFLLKPDSAGRGTLVPFKSTVSADGQNGFGIRIDNNGGSPQFKAWSPNQASGTPNLDIPNGYGQTYFILGKLSVNTDTMVPSTQNTIWVYATGDGLPALEPVSGGSSVTSGWSGNADTARTTLSGRAFSNNTGLTYDEIRIGTTFADVVPTVVPEGSSIAILLLSGLALGVARRGTRAVP